MRDNNYIRIYETERKKINKILSKALKGRKPVSLYEPGSYILNSGGKRLRPLLVLLSAKAVGGDFKNAYNAAAAVEMLHNFTLVHDDIIDRSNLMANLRPFGPSPTQSIPANPTPPPPP